jgi:DNA-binding response OmpR family regulator
MRSKLDGPNGGADDYVTKPFSIAELAAKVHTRLCWREEAGTPLEAGALTLDLATHRARFADMMPFARSARPRCSCVGVENPDPAPKSEFSRPQARP